MVDTILATQGTRWLTFEWMGLMIWQYIGAFIFILLSLLARRLVNHLFERIILPRFHSENVKVTKSLVESMIKPLTAFIGLLGVYGAVRTLMYQVYVGEVTGIISPQLVSQIWEIATAVIIIWALMRLVDVFSLFIRQRAQEEDLNIDMPVIPLVQRALKIFVAVVGSIVVIQQAGYPVAGILGGLGIGGLAIALAAQDTLANVFGSLIIFTDKPFKVGDWVIIGNVEGFVETIGFRSTKIRTWPKSLVTVPNKMISDNTITNWTAMPLRRVKFDLRIGYEATAAQMQTVTERVHKILVDHPGVDKGYFLVNFTEFGVDGLEIMVYYFTKSVVWAEHLRVRQEVNLEIMRVIEDMGLSIGLPGRHIRMADPSNMAMPADSGPRSSPTQQSS